MKKRKFTVLLVVAQSETSKFPAMLTILIIAAFLCAAGWSAWRLAMYLIDRSEKYNVSMFGLHTWLSLGAVSIFWLGSHWADQHPSNFAIGTTAAVGLLGIAIYRVYSQSSDLVFAFALPISMALATLIALFLFLAARGELKRSREQKIKRSAEIRRDVYRKS